MLSRVEVRLPRFTVSSPVLMSCCGSVLTCSILNPDCDASCLDPVGTPDFFFFVPCFAARKQEIIKVTEQLIEAINNGDFEAYT